MALKSVKVPVAFSALFEQAQKYVEDYFSKKEQDPSKGVIRIGGERYILVRAASMSVHFLELIKAMYPGLDGSEALQAASVVLFDMAHSIGMADAKSFHKATAVTDPIAKLSMGPIHFAHTGWAFVDISEESRPSPDENYCLVYDHPQSFEADSWIQSNTKTDFCTCFMNSGYSSGWCQESFGIPLRSQELLCRAKGDPYCRFVMAQPHKLAQYVQEYQSNHLELFQKKAG